MSDRRRNQSEQARGRIELETVARQVCCTSEGQVRERAAEDEIGLAADEGVYGLFRGCSAKQHFLLGGFLFVGGNDISREAKLTRLLAFTGDAERTSPEAPLDDREVRLGEQRQQVRARREQPDFDDPVGHRDDVLDRAERVLERVLAARAELALEDPCDLLVR